MGIPRSTLPATKLWAMQALTAAANQFPGRVKRARTMAIWLRGVLFR
jgi:hypothetical protein